MKYEEFVHHAMYGNEFEGRIDDHKFAYLNVIEDKAVIIIDETELIIDDEKVFQSEIYDGKTFKELFESQRITLTDMF